MNKYNVDIVVIRGRFKCRIRINDGRFAYKRYLKQYNYSLNDLIANVLLDFHWYVSVPST